MLGFRFRAAGRIAGVPLLVALTAGATGLLPAGSSHAGRSHVSSSHAGRSHAGRSHVSSSHAGSAGRAGR